MEHDGRGKWAHPLSLVCRAIVNRKRAISATVCGRVAAMPEDKRKMLQALATKRKADNEGGGRKKPKEAAAVGVVSKGKDVKE